MRKLIEQGIAITKTQGLPTGGPKKWVVYGKDKAGKPVVIDYETAATIQQARDMATHDGIKVDKVVSEAFEEEHGLGKKEKPPVGYCKDCKIFQDMYPEFADKDGKPSCMMCDKPLEPVTFTPEQQSIYNEIEQLEDEVGAADVEQDSIAATDTGADAYHAAGERREVAMKKIADLYKKLGYDYWGANESIKEGLTPGKCSRCGKETDVWKQKGKSTGYCVDCARAIAREELAKIKKTREATDDPMKKEHPGAYCDKCGKTATEGEYSRGECECGGSIVAESKVKEDAVKTPVVLPMSVTPNKTDGEGSDQVPFRKPGKPRGVRKGLPNVQLGLPKTKYEPQSADVLGTGSSGGNVSDSKVADVDAYGKLHERMRKLDEAELSFKLLKKDKSALAKDGYVTVWSNISGRIQTPNLEVPLELEDEAEKLTDAQRDIDNPDLIIAGNIVIATDEERANEVSYEGYGGSVMSNKMVGTTDVDGKKYNVYIVVIDWGYG